MTLIRIHHRRGKILNRYCSSATNISSLRDAITRDECQRRRRRRFIRDSTGNLCDRIEIVRDPTMAFQERGAARY